LTTNLVHNAIMHNLPNGGSVWVTTHNSPDSVVLTVENTGETLAPDWFPRLSSVFSAAASASTVITQVLGLGLAICQEHHASARRTLTLTPPL